MELICSHHMPETEFNIGYFIFEESFSSINFLNNFGEVQGCRFVNADGFSCLMDFFFFLTLFVLSPFLFLQKLSLLLLQKYFLNINLCTTFIEFIVTIQSLSACSILHFSSKFSILSAKDCLKVKLNS